MLSPTMDVGKIMNWNFKEGDFVDVGDYVCEIETDKAVVGYEMLDECYLAKILYPSGTEGIPLGKVIFLKFGHFIHLKCIGVVCEDEGDVEAFADFSADDAGDDGEDAAAEPEPEKEPEAKAEAKAEVVVEKVTAQEGGDSDRVFVSPNAQRVAKE